MTARAEEVGDGTWDVRGLGVEGLEFKGHAYRSW